MEILLAIFGSEGDVRPNLALGQGLIARGHRVRVCASPDSRVLVEEAGFAFQPVGSNVRGLMTVNARYYIDRPFRGVGPMMRALKIDIVKQFEELSRLVGRPDLVIGSGLMLAAPSVAEAMGRPFRLATFTPAILRSGAHGPVVFPLQKETPLLNRLLWAISGIGLELSLRGLLNRERRILGLAPIRNVYKHLVTRVLLAADPELAPIPADADLPCHQTGYWHLRPKETLPPGLERFLGRGPRPVFIGFGSMGDPEPRRTAEAVARAVRAAGVRAVVQSGWGGLRVKADDRVLPVSGRLPHALLFPRVAAVVHHGGAGTIMTAARAGVPQVVVPHLLDQYYWARRIQTLGLGPAPLPRRRLDARRLAAALRTVVEDRRYRQRARARAVPLQRRDGVRQAVDLMPRLARF